MPFTPYQSKVIQFVSIVLVISLGLIYSLVYFGAFDVSRSELEGLTVFNWLTIIALLAFCLPKGMGSICFIFFITFGVFHVGLIFANALGGITDEDTLYQISAWFYDYESTSAMYLINLAFIGFALAALLLSKPIQTMHSNEPLQNSEIDEVRNKRLFHIGGMVLTATILLFFIIAIGTGAINSYGAYLSVVKSSPIVGILFTYCYVFMGLSLIVVVAAHKKHYGFFYFILFGLWSLVAFKTGLRGEVMFPSAVAACVFSRKGIKVNKLLLILAVIGFLVITGIVKSARVSGDYSGNFSVNPLNSVAELGASLRPVQEAIVWRKRGDELLYGASYWAPFERQIALFIPGMERVPALEDPRLLNVLVDKRAGPIGFSPVAEAYLNFGEKGVLFIFFVIGAALAFLDRIPAQPRNNMLIGVSLIPVFIMIRNSFAHVPVQVIISIAFAFICMYSAKVKYRW